jgi:general secretion pathway protein H
MRIAMSAERRSPRKARGFTLVEILVVVGLIAVLTTVLAVSMSGGIGGLQLRSTAKEIAAELRHARAQAMSKSEVQSFVIDPRKRAWAGARGRSGELPKDLEVTFVGARELQPREGQGAILFFEDGASSGGRIQLRYKTAGWNVDVAWLTGEVSLHRARIDRGGVDRSDPPEARAAAGEGE